MDPFSAIGSIGGALINMFGQQSTNQANLQFAQQQASGAFLPSYVAAEKAAGINPYSAGSGPSASFHADNPLAGFSNLQLKSAGPGQDPLDTAIKREELRHVKLINDDHELALAKIAARGASAPSGTVNQSLDRAFGTRPGKEPPFPYNLIGPGVSGVLSGIDTGAGFIQRHIPQSVSDWLSSHGMD